MQDKKMLCYCGHDCARCVTYRATVENNDELRRQSQKFYKEEFRKDIPLEQIHCTAAEPRKFFIFAKGVRG